MAQSRRGGSSSSCSGGDGGSSSSGGSSSNSSSSSSKRFYQLPATSPAYSIVPRAHIQPHQVHLQLLTHSQGSNRSTYSMAQGPPSTLQPTLILLFWLPCLQELCTALQPLSP